MEIIRIVVESLKSNGKTFSRIERLELPPALANIYQRLRREKEMKTLDPKYDVGNQRTRLYVINHLAFKAGTSGEHEKKNVALTHSMAQWTILLCCSLFYEKIQFRL
jgi:uracil DNA glycosylase